jgi:hypothetical protein
MGSVLAEFPGESTLSYYHDGEETILAKGTLALLTQPGTCDVNNNQSSRTSSPPYQLSDTPESYLVISVDGVELVAPAAVARQGHDTYVWPVTETEPHQGGNGEQHIKINLSKEATERSEQFEVRFFQVFSRRQYCSWVFGRAF